MGGCNCKTKDNIKPKSVKDKGLIKCKSGIQFREEYEFISILGKGLYGEVRLYSKKGDIKSLFAVKTIHKHHLSTSHINSFKFEVNILNGIDHPNICKFYEAYEEDRYIHLVMEYSNGNNLYKMISLKNKVNYTYGDIADILHYILKALIYFHSKGLVHKDVRPNNIIFDYNTDNKSILSLKLVNYGISINDNLEFIKLTNKESIKFYPPEFFSGLYYFNSDSWGVGIIMYILITGIFPFETNNNLVNNILNGIYKDSCVITKYDIPKDALDLLNKLLTINVEERISCIDALKHNFIEKRHTYTNSGHSISKEVIKSINSFNDKNCFQKEILYYIARLYNSNDSELAKLKEAFEKFDINKTSYIDYKEFVECVKKFYNNDNKKINSIWNSLDNNKSGKIEYTQFIASTYKNTVRYFYIIIKYIIRSL